MTDAKLLHVGTTELHAMRLLPGQRHPTWPTDDAGEGNVRVIRWSDDQHAMMLMSLSMQREEHAVRVIIGALYEFPEGATFPRTLEDQELFCREHVEEVTPFLRQAIYNVSSQVWPVNPIMLDATLEMTMPTGATSN